MLEVYVDGSCLGSPQGVGGWAAVLRTIYLGSLLEMEVSGFEYKSTSNRMEVYAAIQGLKALNILGIELSLYSDSQYLIQGATRRSKRKINLDLWQQLDSLTENYSIDWVLVKGHSGHVTQERVDKLARHAAKSQTSSMCFHYRGKVYDNFPKVQ